LKIKKWHIVLGIALSIILVFFLSYGITFKSMEAINASNEMKRVIQGITVSKVEVTQLAEDGNPSMEYSIVIKLPSEITKQDIEKSVGFSLIFKSKTREIYGMENSSVVRDFNENPNDPAQYIVKFTLKPSSEKPEDLEHLLNNKTNNLEFALYNKDEKVKNIPLK
jgi:hypothetical protein